ncbi:MAG TPA: succinate--CoA ligase subunit alpha [Rhizomicrobium sp.]
MIASLVTPQMKVLVQGLTGRAGRAQTARMLHYGTDIVAGVSPRDDATGPVPCFRNCAEAVAATGAEASVIIVPPLAVLESIRDAVGAGIRLIVSISEGVPIHDALKARALVRAAGVRWIGPSTPGLAIPGRIKLGFLPDISLAPGRLGVMSKSGTLSYEVCHRLVTRGLGQSLWVGVGGDPVKGTRFADLLPVFEDDQDTDGLVVVGEVGGNEEEDLARRIVEDRFSKPVFALVAGRNAREGVTMGHAGALAGDGQGSVEAKAEALQAAGAMVFARIEDLASAVAQRFSQDRHHKALRAATV